MDGLKHPVGEQTPNVYWRRRVAVIAAIIVLGLLVWWVLGALTAGPATPGASNSPGATTSPSPTESTAADPGRDCTAEDVKVAAVAPETIAASKAPTFTVTVTSTASSPCIVDPTKGSKIVVRSGDDQWFDSSKCTDYTTFDAEPFLLDAEGEHELTTSWNYGRDDAGCSADLQEADAGTYKVKATVSGVAAKEATFTVTS